MRIILNHAAAFFENHFSNASQKKLPAQYYLGYMYAKGRGVAKDYTKAYSWLYVAATANEPHALRAIRKIENKLNHAELAYAIKAGKRLSAEFEL